MKRKRGTLKFKAQDVLVLINHALSSKKFRATFAEGYNDDLTKKSDEEIAKIVKPGLWLVKDRGAYLMSNGNPGLKRYEVDAELKKRIVKSCELFKKDLIADKEFWRNDLPDFVDGMNMDAIKFAEKFFDVYLGKKEEKDVLETARILITYPDITLVRNHHVVYAKGFEGNEYDYNELRKVCGGDDFVELVDYNMMMQFKSIIENRNAKWICFDMYDMEYRIRFLYQ